MTDKADRKAPSPKDWKAIQQQVEALARKAQQAQAAKRLVKQ